MRAHVGCRGPGFLHTATLNRQGPAAVVCLAITARVGLTTGDLQPRDRADAGQRLATKTQAMDFRQVLVGQFAGCVALDGQTQALTAHPVAVVADADQAFATIANVDLHVCRARVQAVFSQLFHHAGRAVNDLTRRDLVYQDLWQQPNPARGCLGGRLGGAVMIRLGYHDIAQLFAHQGLAV